MTSAFLGTEHMGSHQVLGVVPPQYLKLRVLKCVLIRTHTYTLVKTPTATRELSST